MCQIKTSSSGLSPEQGRQSPPNAITVAGNFGVNLSSHYAQNTSRDQITKSDIVFLMDGPNYDSFKRRFPEYLNKTFFLGTMGRNEQYAIPDPFGGDIKEFEQTYEKISNLIRKVASHITS
jgi:protein-tyrosine phosphatase